MCLNRRVVYLERRVESLAVCMPHMDNKCANFYSKDLTLNAERQRLLCAWALTVMPDCLKGRTVIIVCGTVGDKSQEYTVLHDLLCPKNTHFNG